MLLNMAGTVEGSAFLHLQLTCGPGQLYFCCENALNLMMRQKAVWGFITCSGGWICYIRAGTNFKPR